MEADSSFAGLIGNFLSAAAIAIFSSWVTVRLSLGSFRTEKWWELKAETYRRIIECLHHQKFCAEKMLKKEFEGVNYSEGFLKNLNEENTKAYLELSKILNTGEFILPKDAYDALAAYQAAKDAAGETHIDQLETVEVEAEKCLKKLIAIGQRDLNTEPFADVQTFLAGIPQAARTIVARAPIKQLLFKLMKKKEHSETEKQG